MYVVKDGHSRIICTAFATQCFNSQYNAQAANLHSIHTSGLVNKHSPENPAPRTTLDIEGCLPRKGCPSGVLCVREAVNNLLSGEQ